MWYSIFTLRVASYFHDFERNHKAHILKCMYLKQIWTTNKTASRKCVHLLSRFSEDIARGRNNQERDWTSNKRDNVKKEAISACHWMKLRKVVRKGWTEGWNKMGKKWGREIEQRKEKYGNWKRILTARWKQTTIKTDIVRRRKEKKAKIRSIFSAHSLFLIIFSILFPGHLLKLMSKWDYERTRGKEIKRERRKSKYDMWDTREN